MWPAGIRYRDRAVYLSASDVLVLADLHLGRGRRDVVAAPLDDRLDLAGRVSALCDVFDPARVVIAGDLLDAFDAVPPGVVERADAIQAAIRTAGAEPILLAGNHDEMVTSVLDWPVREEYLIDETVICHGHTHPEASGERYVIGHEHPSLRVEGKKRPCYLVGTGVLDDAGLCVLPAFSPLLRGTALNHRRAADCASPLLRETALRQCHPVLRDEATEDTLRFPGLDRMVAFL